LKTVNRITIRAPWKKVFEAAEAIVEWPRLLEHYRWVTLLGGAQVEMAARRGPIPCKWQSDQVAYPRQKKIYYKHTKSFWSQGMLVWWILKPLKNGGTEVTITHDMPKANFLKAWFQQHVIGGLFVEPIAAKTLAGLKRHLERA
jgi:hypothetical protein